MIENKLIIKKRLFLYIFFIIFITNLHCYAKDMKHTVSLRPDGGYNIDVTISKRHMQLITAEGIFPKEIKNFKIEIIGKGKNWSYRNQNGFFYGIEQIKCLNNAWDFGYAWVDSERKYLYLNLYWVSSPDSLIPSDVNGKYRLIGD